VFLNTSKAKRHKSTTTTTTTTATSDQPNSLMVPPALASIASVQESSARVLFLMNNWLKSQAQFNLIPLSDQLYLIEQNWKDLLLTSLVQWMVPIHLVSEKELLQTVEALGQREADADECLRGFRQVQEMFVKLAEMNMKPVEMDLFKMILVLRADSWACLSNEQGVRLVQANVVKSLLATVGVNGSRLAGILLLASELHGKVCERTMEMVLFKYFIGGLSMRKIVVELFEAGLRCQ